MNKKIAVAILLVLILTMGSVFAYDAGTLSMYIEPSYGILFPDTVDARDGMSGSLGVLVSYNFMDFLGANAGLGVTGLFLYEDLVYYYMAYLTVPIGFNFSYKLLYGGAGITVNIPVYANIEYTYYNESFDFLDQAQTYIGFYIDFGFDTAGQKNQKNGYGMALRFSGSISNEALVENFKFRYLGVSIVFRPSFRLAVLNSKE